MEEGPYDGLGLFPFRHLHRFDRAFPPNPSEVAHKVDVIGAIAKGLGHDGVVVPVRRKVAVTAVSGLRFPHRMGEMGIDRLRAVTACRHGWLLNIDLLSVGVGRGQHQRRGGAKGCYPATVDPPATTNHKDLISHHLRVVGRKVSRLPAFVMMPFRFPIGLDGKMAAATARGPGGVAGVALHFFVAVGALFRGHVLTPVLASRIGAHKLGSSRLFVVPRVALRDRVLYEAHFPLEPRIRRLR